MATLPAFLRKTDGLQTPPPRKQASPRPERDPFQLRALPLESVVFYCKRIDNSRLVREPDPKARGACWSAIGAACAVVALLTGAAVPSVANRIAGYRLEELRAEERNLTAERRVLEMRQAEILSPQNLDALAKARELAPPASGQITHLDGKSDGAMAMVEK